MSFSEVLVTLLELLLDYLNEQTSQDWSYSPTNANFQLTTNFQSQLPGEVAPDPKIKLKIVADTTDKFKFTVESSHSPINETEKIRVGAKLKEANDVAYKSLRIFNDFLGDNIIYYYLVLIPKEVISSPDVARIDIRVGPFIRLKSNLVEDKQEIVDEAKVKFSSIRAMLNSSHAIVEGVTYSKMLEIEYATGNTEFFE